MATCWPSFLYGVIYRGDKARVEEEKEVRFTINQFEILLCELLELLLSSSHSITLRLIYVKLIALKSIYKVILITVEVENFFIKSECCDGDIAVKILVRSLNTSLHA